MTFGAGGGSRGGKSAFLRQHDRDGRLRVVHVERAASGDELDKARVPVVVADIERNGQAVNARPAATDGKAQHRQRPRWRASERGLV